MANGDNTQQEQGSSTSLLSSIPVIGPVLDSVDSTVQINTGEGSIGFTTGENPSFQFAVGGSRRSNADAVLDNQAIFRSQLSQQRRIEREDFNLRQAQQRAQTQRRIDELRLTREEQLNSQREIALQKSVQQEEARTALLQDVDELTTLTNANDLSAVVKAAEIVGKNKGATDETVRTTVDQVISGLNGEEFSTEAFDGRAKTLAQAALALNSKNEEDRAEARKFFGEPDRGLTPDQIEAFANRLAPFQNSLSTIVRTGDRRRLERDSARRVEVNELIGQLERSRSALLRDKNR